MSIYTHADGASSHPEEVLDFLTSRLVTSSGVFDVDGGELLVEESDTPAMSVKINSGYAYLQKSDLTKTYPVYIDVDDSVAISDNASGNTRIDAIVLYYNGGATPSADSTGVATLVAIEGTPDASPIAPTDNEIQTAIGASNPFIRLADVTVDSGETQILDADITDQRTEASYSTKVSKSDWESISGTFSRDSSDDPVYVMTVSSQDLTGSLSEGMRIKWTQNSVERFGIIVAVALDGSDTDITILSRCDSASGDYDLLDEGTYVISEVYYSSKKAPFGFPLNPNYWSVETNDTSNNSQASPSASTWYNVGSLSLDIPIGVWRVSYFLNVRADHGSSGTYSFNTTLSTAANSESDSDFTCYVSNGDMVQLSANVNREKYLNLGVKDTYYLNARVNQASFNNLAFRGDLGATIIRAVCAYL